MSTLPICFNGFKISAEKVCCDSILTGGFGGAKLG